VPCDIVGPLHPPSSERVVLYLHGGAFCVHMPRSYKRFARRLAEACGATVCVPAYRLAPEHRYPAGADDCLAVYRALLNDGCDPRRLCLMGDSAGGNLALVTLLRARDEKLPLPACAIVLSPGADLTFSGASYRRNAEDDPLNWTLGALHQVAKQYADADNMTHPHVSPIQGDFTGLPPLKILVGSTEVLLDDSIAVAESCRAAGGDVELHVWHQMPHVFPIYSFLPEGRMAAAHGRLLLHTPLSASCRRRKQIMRQLSGQDASFLYLTNAHARSMVFISTRDGAKTAGGFETSCDMSRAGFRYRACLASAWRMCRWNSTIRTGLTMRISTSSTTCATWRCPNPATGASSTSSSRD
jgi:acetyl esterase/lipase